MISAPTFYGVYIVTVPRKSCVLNGGRPIGARYIVLPPLEVQSIPGYTQKGLSNFPSISYEVFLYEFWKVMSLRSAKQTLGEAVYSRTDLGHLAKFVSRDKASEEAMSRITRSPMRAVPAHFNSYHVNIKGTRSPLPRKR